MLDDFYHILQTAARRNEFKDKAAGQFDGEARRRDEPLNVLCLKAFSAAQRKQVRRQIQYQGVFIVGCTSDGSVFLRQSSRVRNLLFYVWFPFVTDGRRRLSNAPPF